MDGAIYDMPLTDMDDWIKKEAKRANDFNRWKGIIPGLCTTLGHPICTTEMYCKKGAFYNRPRWDAARHICTTLRENLSKDKAKIYNDLYRTYLEMDTSGGAMPAWESIFGHVAHNDARADERVVVPLSTPCGVLMGPPEKREKAGPKEDPEGTVEEDPSTGGPFMVRLR